jgi:hypothetical protein
LTNREYFVQVCGLCPTGWAFIAKGCQFCPAEEDLGPIRKAVICCFALLCLVFWFFVSWKPLFSESESTTVENSSKKAGKLQNFKEKMLKASKSLRELPKEIVKAKKHVATSAGCTRGISMDGIGQYIKLIISFYQVTACFLTFSVQWPSLLLSLMTWIKGILFLDILQLPGIACLWTGINFKQRLLTYTLVPIAAICCFEMPCFFGWLMGHSRAATDGRWAATVDAAWKNILYWVFLVYPVVSLTTLQAFDCQPEGLGLLAADLNMKCPNSADLVSVWSIIFILVYPVGIPLFCMISMLNMGVYLIAQDKINKNILSSIIAKYMQLTTTVESRKIAKVFEKHGSKNSDSVANDSIEREMKIRLVYNAFFDEEGKLRKIEKHDSTASPEVDFASIQSILIQYNKDTDHAISLDEFRGMILNLVNEISIFTGVESDRLTNEQAIALLAFDWKSAIPKPGKPNEDKLKCKANDQAKDPETKQSSERAGKTKSITNFVQTSMERCEKSFKMGHAVLTFGQDVAPGSISAVSTEPATHAIATNDGNRNLNEGSKANDPDHGQPETAGDIGAYGDKKSAKWDRESLEIICATSRYKHKIAEEIWKLGNTLLKGKVISIPNIVWSQNDFVAAEHASDSILESDISQRFVIHPDLKDEYLQKNALHSFFRLISLGSLTIPEHWKSVSQRKSLEKLAMRRVGFLFLAYKVNFWFWEIIEMTRK